MKYLAVKNELEMTHLYGIKISEEEFSLYGIPLLQKSMGDAVWEEGTLEQKIAFLVWVMQKLDEKTASREKQVGTGYLSQYMASGSCAQTFGSAVPVGGFLQYTPWNSLMPPHQLFPPNPPNPPAPVAEPPKKWWAVWRDVIKDFLETPFWDVLLFFCTGKQTVRFANWIGGPHVDRRQR